MKKIQSLLLCLLLMSMCVFTNCKDKKEIKDILDEAKAKVTTSVPSDVSFISATVGGVISNPTGDIIGVRGVCWTTGNEDPKLPSNLSDFSLATLKNQDLLALSDSIYADGVTFTCKFRGIPNQTYKVRAFVISSKSAFSNDPVSYGEVVELSTTTIANGANKPVVTTGEYGNLTKNAAIGYGSVTTANGDIIAKGVCWGKLVDIIDATKDANLFSFADKNSPNENFSSNIKGLLPGVEYKFKAFAVNKDGIAYGDSVVFETPITK